MERWHSFSIEQIEEKLNTSASLGLSRAEAEARIDTEIRDGKKNRLPLYCKKRGNILSLIFSPFASITYVLYLTVALFAFFKGETYFGAWAIALLICQGVLLGILNLRSTRAKERADLYSNPTVKLLRSGVVKYTDSRNIAVGDVILLSAGDVIPSDARLIEDDALTVDEFLYDESNKKLLRRRTVKNSQKVYGSDTAVTLRDAQNIILAGSVIVSGSGRAIAVSVAEDVLLAAHLHNGEMAGDIKRPLGISKLLSWVHKICIFAAALLLTVTVIGMFTLRSQSFYTIFLLAISSMLYISAALVDIWSKAFFYIAADKLPEGVVIKYNKVFDILTGFSDILLLGRAGLTDGELHISSLFLAGRRLDTSMIEAKPDRTHRLCEYIYTYLKVIKNRENSQVREYASALDSFMTQVGYDREGADLRISSLYYIEEADSAFAQTSGTNVRLSVTPNEKIILNCKHLRVGDMSVPIDVNLRDRIIHYIDECESAGDKLVFVVSEEVDGTHSKGENAILEGIISLEEHITEGLNEVLEKYKEMGVNLTVFMADESAESIKYLIQSGIISSETDNKIAFASSFTHHGYDITHNFGKYRAYLGFDMSEYCALVGHMRKEGRVVAAYGVEDVFNSVATLADTSATCNNIEYDSREYSESYFESYPDMGGETSSLATQRGRLSSGLLVKRTENGGGLSGIINAADISSSAYINLSYFLKYFSIQGAGLVSLVILSALSGFVLINPVQISFLYLFICVLGLCRFASNIPRNEMLRRQKRGYIALPEVMIKSSLPKIITRMCASLIFFIAALILALCGVISRDGISFSAFVSAFCVCIIDIIAVSREYSQGNTKKAKVSLLTLVSIIFVALILLSVVGLYLIDVIFKGEYAYLTRIPERVISVVYGGKVDLWALILIPVFVTVCIISDKLCDKFYLKVKNKIKKSK